MDKERNVSVIEDLDGRKIVIIHDIRFRGKRKINWKEVEQYLKQYIGEVYEIMDSADIVYVGGDFADEFSGSQDTERLKGTLAKAKANAAQGIPVSWALEINVAQNPYSACSFRLAPSRRPQ